MSALLECGNCGVCEVVSLSGALAAGWRPGPQQPICKGIWTCPSCAAADDDLDRQVHEMIEERTGGESR